MTKEMTAATFLDLLRTSGLLEPTRVNELSRLPEARADSPTDLARVILRRGWLTRFQLNAAAAGRAESLVVGPYVLIDKLGEGGMGTVYKARHQHMQRFVALKVIRKEKLTGPVAVARFYQEVRVAGQLSHPNIVLAHDAGPVGSNHYFAMEYVEGVDLARLVMEKGKLSPAQACEYVRQAALGLQHAHEKGMVHRDIKPANLLLAGGASGAPSVVKLLDLGLARLQSDGDTGLTRLGAVIGTPDYLAPEQAMNSRAADIRSDLYSLGCTLHFLLTGRPPFAATELTEVLLKHQSEKPKPLLVFGVEAPAEVQSILDKLLAKKPEDRYQTPTELIADLAPLCGQSVSADAIETGRVKPAAADPWQSLDGGQASGDGETATSTVRGRRLTVPTDRRRLYLLLAACGGTGGVVLLLLLLVWLLWPSASPAPSAGQSQRRGPETRTARPPDKETVRVPAPDVPNFPYFQGVVPADAPLAKLDPKKVLPEDRPAKLRGVVAVIKGHTKTVWSLAFSPDGKMLATSSEDSSVRLWDVSGKEPVLHATLVEGIGGGISGLAFSPDGRYLAYGSQGGVLQMWDVSGARPKAHADLRGLSLSAQSAVFTPDSRTMASTDGASVRLWDLRGEAPKDRRLEGHTRQVNALAFSPDGKLLATGADDGLVRLWDLSPADPKLVGVLDIKPAEIWMAAFAPDGRSLVVTTRTGAGRICDVSATGIKERAKLPNDDSSLVHIAGFDAVGQTFVTYGGPCLRRWELPGGRLREEWPNPLGGGNWVYSPDRRHAALSEPVKSTVYLLRLTTPGSD